MKILFLIQKKNKKTKVIIFSAYRSFLDILYYHLKKKYKISRFHGGLSKNKKSLELEEFKNGSSTILLSVFKCGGLGLNLTCATEMIMCEPPYTHADWIQGVCRMYRYFF